MCAFFIFKIFQYGTLILAFGLPIWSEPDAFLTRSQEYLARRDYFRLEPEQFASVRLFFYPGYFKMFAFSAIYRHK